MTGGLNCKNQNQEGRNKNSEMARGVKRNLQYRGGLNVIDVKVEGVGPNI